MPKADRILVVDDEEEIRKIICRMLASADYQCLSLPGDVELKEIYRRQKRLEITLEMGDSDLDDGLHFLPAPSLNRESILEAVHRLEKDSTLLGEEVFWLHGLQGKIDLNADK